LETSQTIKGHHRVDSATILITDLLEDLAIKDLLKEDLEIKDHHKEDSAIKDHRVDSATILTTDLLGDLEIKDLLKEDLAIKDHHKEDLAIKDLLKVEDSVDTRKSQIMWTKMALDKSNYLAKKSTLLFSSYFVT